MNMPDSCWTAACFESPMVIQSLQTGVPEAAAYAESPAAHVLHAAGHPPGMGVGVGVCADGAGVVVVSAAALKKQLTKKALESVKQTRVRNLVELQIQNAPRTRRHCAPTVKSFPNWQ